MCVFLCRRLLCALEVGSGFGDIGMSESAFGMKKNRKETACALHDSFCLSLSRQAYRTVLMEHISEYRGGLSMEWDHETPHAHSRATESRQGSRQQSRQPKAHQVSYHAMCYAMP